MAVWVQDDCKCTGCLRLCSHGWKLRPMTAAQHHDRVLHHVWVAKKRSVNFLLSVYHFYTIRKSESCESNHCMSRTICILIDCSLYTKKRSCPHEPYICQVLVRVMKKSKTRGGGGGWSGDTVLGGLFRETRRSPRVTPEQPWRKWGRGRAGIWGEGTPKAEVLGTHKQACRMPVRLGQWVERRVAGDEARAQTLRVSAAKAAVWVLF